MMFGYERRSIFSGIAAPAIAVAIGLASVVALVILDNAKSAGSLKQAAMRNAEIAMAERLGRDEDEQIFQQTLDAQNRVNAAATEARVAAAERQARREARRKGLEDGRAEALDEAEERIADAAEEARFEGRWEGRQEALSEALPKTGPGGLPYCPVDCLLEKPP